MEHALADSIFPSTAAAEASDPMLDVRAIANKVLDYADSRNLPVSNMALNKIVYFVHCDFLLEQQQPLVSAKIEAWKHGPIFREVYSEFKRWDDRAIKSRATKVDLNTGQIVQAAVTFDIEEERYIETLIERYIRFTAAQLRALSHIIGGPWHRVWGHDGNANPGMKITNELIRESYCPGALQ